MTVCGVRTEYYKHNSGLCVLPPHSDDVEHLVEVVTVDSQKVRYDKVKKGGNQMAVELRPHQQKAVDELSNGKILWGGVGTGKTIASLAYFYSKVCKGVYGDMGSMRTPKDIYVITTAKKRDDLDWEKEAALFGIGKEPDGSVPGVTLTVDSWNNIGKYTGVHGAFFIFDEQRLVGSGAWTKAFIKIAKSNEWILLSATPGDTWLDYIPVFVANGFYRNRTEFKREHVVYNTYSKFPKVDRYIGVGKLLRLRNQLLVHMPYERHTRRIPKDVHVEYDKDLFEMVVKKRWHVYENRPLRDVAELFLVMRKVVNSSPSRLTAVRELLRTHPRLIVFYNFDYELEMLRTLPSLLMDSQSHTSGYTAFETCGGEQNPMSDQQIQEALEKHTWPEEDVFPMANPTMPGLSTEQISRISSSPSLSDHGRSIESGTGSTTFEASATKDDFLNGYWTEDEGDGEEFVPYASDLVVAEWNGHKHQPIPTSDRWVYLVQYVAGSEGWNCVETDAICFYSLTYSYKNYEQAHGRIDRLNTPFTDLYYYTLLSDSAIDRAVMKALRSKKNFNESSFRA